MATIKQQPYDHVDAAYIFLGLYNSYAKAVDGERERGNENGPMEHLIDYHSGECHLMAHMFDTAISASQALSSIVDFDSADLGMFAYDWLDSIEPGSLISAVWTNCILEHKCAGDIVSIFVRGKGWPTNDSPAPTNSPWLNNIASIQIQTTCQTDPDNTHVVSCDDITATHWSVYVRNNEGLADWVDDFVILPGDTGQARLAAQMVANSLASQYGVDIEPVK
jgi:hypothetical protein